MRSALAAPLVLPSPSRSFRMVQRNLLVYKHGWMIIFSGFFEPLFYLLGIGFGLGSMVPDVAGVNYAAFVAPGLLASSCLNGALTDGFFNIWFKLRMQKTYDGILATPMRVADVACGELMWALTRGSLYAASFLLVVLVVGEVQGPRMLMSPVAVLALPAAVLVSASLSSMGLCATTFVRKIEDFDIVMGLAVTPMFLFSGIFFPVAQLPDAIRWILQIVPLYHAVELLRALTTGVLTPALWWHLLYLVGCGVVAFVVTLRRLERTLIK